METYVKHPVEAIETVIDYLYACICELETAGLEKAADKLRETRSNLERQLEIAHNL